jgi:hypothetical protein
MTLKEKFQEEPVVVYKENFKLTNQSAEQFEQIADEFAIGFIKWYASNEGMDLIHDLQIIGEIGKDVSPEEILEIYKKEKGI